MSKPRRTCRINARLPEDVARKATYLERRTGKSTTEVIVASIERYYDELNPADGAVAGLLDGFVGCAEGPVDLSSSYKKELLASLRKKAQTT